MIIHHFLYFKLFIPGHNFLHLKNRLFFHYPVLMDLLTNSSFILLCMLVNMWWQKFLRAFIIGRRPHLLWQRKLDLVQELEGEKKINTAPIFTEHEKRTCRERMCGSRIPLTPSNTLPKNDISIGWKWFAAIVIRENISFHYCFKATMNILTEDTEKFALF